MQAQEDLIRFKTDAWKGTGMVANYAQRMHDNRGTNRLKNAVEVALCRENVTGREILDVGIGTGRGSLPLAREGYRVTGLDVSQAMLDQCRREAGETSIELVQGDLTALPFGDESFDSLISLNVAVHFPNWREALRDWARVVRPDGRLVFDVHSSDHLQSVARARGCAPEDLLSAGQRNDPSQFMLRIGAQDVADAASQLGLSIVTIIPYAAVLGGGNINYWLWDSRLDGSLGDRALSWMAVDEKLFEFGEFLERELFAFLSTAATGRFMVVLQKTPDPSRNRELANTYMQINSAFEDGVSSTALADNGFDGARCRESALAYLEHPQNETLLAMLLSGSLGRRLAPLFGELLGEETARRVLRANERQRIDTEIYEFVTGWARARTDAAFLEYKGVDLSSVLAYDLMKDLLRSEFFESGDRK